MKTIRNLLLIISLFFAITSCVKEMIDFQGENGIYFEMRRKTPTGMGIWPLVDTTMIPFASTLADDSIGIIKFKLFGRMADYDRHIQIKILESSTAVLGREYEVFPLSTLLLANHDIAIFPIKFFRSDSILNDHKYLTIEIITNSDFPFQLEYYKSRDFVSQQNILYNVKRHTLDLSDALFCPLVWSERYLGVYSDYKFKYINDKFGYTQEDWASQESMSFARMEYIALTLKRYIVEMEEAGTPLYERDKYGNIIYQKDAQGNYILDKNGDKIPVKLAVGV